MIGIIFWTLVSFADPTRLFTFSNGAYLALDAESKVIVVASDGSVLRSFDARPALVPVQGVYPAEIVMYQIPTHTQPDYVTEYAILGLDLGKAGKELLLVRQTGESRTIGSFSPESSIRWVIDSTEQTHSIVQTVERTVVCSGPGTVREMFRRTELESLATMAAEALRRSDFAISRGELEAILRAIRNANDGTTLERIKLLLTATVANAKNAAFAWGPSDAIASILRMIKRPCDKALVN